MLVDVGHVGDVEDQAPGELALNAEAPVVGRGQKVIRRAALDVLGGEEALRTFENREIDADPDAALPPLRCAYVPASNRASARSSDSGFVFAESRSLAFRPMK